MGQYNPYRIARLVVLLGLLGTAAGMAAVLYQAGIETVFHLCMTGWVGLPPESPVYRETSRGLTSPGVFRSWLIILMPGIGGLIVGVLSWLIARISGDQDCDEINAYLQRQGDYPLFRPSINLLLSVITLGTGGSGGKESPAGSVGAGLGSFIGKHFLPDSRTRRLFMAAGVAAGIGAIFRIPVAATFFAMEFYYSNEELEAGIMLPAALTSAVSYAVFAHFYGFAPLFPDAVSFRFSSALDLVAYAASAFISCAGAYIFVKFFQFVSNGFERLKSPGFVKPSIGGLAGGLIGWAAWEATGHPASFSIIGDGFGVILKIFSGHIQEIGLGILLLIGIGKILTTCLTIGSGGVAGLFSPSLIMGGTIGGACGLAANLLLPGLTPPPEGFVLIGMSAFFAAAFKAPICASFIACELTGDFSLIMPAFTACAISFYFSRGWTIYSRQLPAREPISDLR